MSTLSIREFRDGDEPALHAIFHSAIHRVARADYTSEQIDAWAPPDMDQDLWARRLRSLRPFVAELNGEIVGYADLQPNGYIDHFFVSGHHPCAGIGSCLMNHVLAAARSRGMAALTSDVSLTAQPFYKRFGFVLVERRTVVRRGVTIPNALMRKDLTVSETLHAEDSGHS